MAPNATNFDARLQRLNPTYRKQVLDSLEKCEKQQKDDFVKRVHDLPPELFNIVQEYTFNIDEGAVVRVDKEYRFPATLRARSLMPNGWIDKFVYFKKTVFVFEDMDIAVKWFEAVAKLGCSYSASDWRLITTSQLEASARGVDMYANSIKLICNANEQLRNHGVYAVNPKIKVQYPGEAIATWTNSPNHEYHAWRARQRG